jgi:hypothetical protein
MFTKTSLGFPAFLTYDVSKVVPTKVHLISHIHVIQRFVSHRLYTRPSSMLGKGQCKICYKKIMT